MRGTTLLTTMLLTLLVSGCLASDDDDGDATSDMDDQASQANNTTAPELTPVSLDVGLSGAYPVTIAYDPGTLTVANNTLVNLTFTNTDQNPLGSHDWAIEGYEDTAGTDVIGTGQSATISFEAPPPGTYAFYCTVPGHRDNGMEGTFTVEA